MNVCRHVDVRYWPNRCARGQSPRKAADPKAIWNENETGVQEQEDPFYDPEDKRPQPW